MAPTALAEKTAALMTGVGAGAANLGGGEASTSLPAINGVPAPSSAAGNANGVAEKPASKEPAPAAGSKSDASKVATPSNDSSIDIAGSKTPTSMNRGSTADTPQDTPASTPRRRIKKRRHGDFVYAADKKAQKPASGAKPKDPECAEPAKKKRKRPRKCPAKDSILMEVPLSVTVDVGVALKRTRRKRTQRIKEWVASGAAPAAAKKKGASPKNGKTSPKNGSGTKDNTPGEAEGEGGSESLELGEDDLEPLEINRHASRHGQGNVLDYLEAKYVRGVMLDDYDERETNTKGEDGGAESDESDGKISCYDDADGWLDDSLMIEEVAGQVVASSAYGMTQIEEEAKKRKEGRKKGKEGTADAGDGDGKPSNALEGLEGLVEEDKSDGERSEGEDSDFDDGFFVNLGDLEMAEGWNDEVDMGISPEKKKKKRAYNKKAKSPKEKGKAKSKTAKKKGTNAKAAAPGAKKKAAKKAKEEGKKAGAKKTKGEDGKAAKKVGKKAVGEGKDTPKKKKKATTSVLESATTPKEGKKASAKKAAAKKGDASGKKKAEGDSATPKKKSPESKEKEAATKLKRLYKRRYTACVKLIEEMTSKELPRKPRNKSIKVSVNIPPDKTIGDEITFSNPNVPGQKLKAKIPKKADLENRCFVVSIPLPKVAEPEAKDNNVFSKELKTAVYNYATAYDDWCVAEGEYNETLPKDKQKDFKPNIAKKERFDEMVLEFPKNLATPVDEARLRKIVNQERSNALRREKRKQVVKQEESAIHIPQKGTAFPAVVFNKQNFEEGK